MVWVIGKESGTINVLRFPGHTASISTSTHQEVVVDNYTNLKKRYQCGAILTNRTIVQSNNYTKMDIESKK